MALNTKTKIEGRMSIRAVQTALDNRGHISRAGCTYTLANSFVYSEDNTYLGRTGNQESIQYYFNIAWSMPLGGRWVSHDLKPILETEQILRKLITGK